MLDYQKRVISEKEELEGRIKRLRQFTESAEFKAINNVNQQLLFRQLGIMEEYLVVLNERINLF